MVSIYAFTVWRVSAEIFGVKFGHAYPSGSTSAPTNVQSPSLKFTQFLWMGNPDWFEDDILRHFLRCVSLFDFVQGLSDGLRDAGAWFDYYVGYVVLL